jgi:hypothetical protein
MNQIPFPLRTLFTSAILIIFFSTFAIAQPGTGKFINISIGLGITAPYDINDDVVDIIGTGFYAQGEYVFGLTKWFGVRPYAGILLTSEDKEDQSPYKVTSRAFLAGIKGRVLAPIPWVAPYIEIGVGASAGTFETFTPYTQIKEHNVILHIPFSLGLALGPKNNVDVEFTYYFHPAVEQFGGAAAIGITLPLK